MSDKEINIAILQELKRLWISRKECCRCIATREDCKRDIYK